MLRRVPDEIVRLGGDDVSVEIIPAIGARIHRLVAFGHDLLRTPPSVAAHRREPFFWGGYLMAPWCNRAPAGRVPVGGRVLVLEANFPDGTAIHGLVHDRPWAPDGEAGWRIDVPTGRWPWRFAARFRCSVDARRVLIELAVENHDDVAMPAGIGWHPWFRAPIEVTIPAAAVYESNVASSPAPVGVAGEFDRRTGGHLPVGVDATWTDLETQDVVLHWPHLGMRASVRLSDSVGFVVAAAPPDLAAVAVEPQTHGPDGIRRLIEHEPGAPTWIEPGAALTARIELTFSQP
jgi:aldose 1-epimerase